MMSVGILGIGSFVPPAVRTNVDSFRCVRRATTTSRSEM